MNADEMRWLLRTISDRETAQRFVEAQCKRGRISYQLVADLAREQGWTDYPAAQALSAKSAA